MCGSPTSTLSTVFPHRILLLFCQSLRIILGWGKNKGHTLTAGRKSPSAGVARAVTVRNWYLQLCLEEALKRVISSMWYVLCGQKYVDTSLSNVPFLILRVVWPVTDFQTCPLSLHRWLTRAASAGQTFCRLARWKDGVSRWCKVTMLLLSIALIRSLLNPGGVQHKAWPPQTGCHMSPADKWQFRVTKPTKPHVFREVTTIPRGTLHKHRWLSCH